MYVESWTVNLVLLALTISGIMLDDSGKLRFGCICAAVINLTMGIAVLVLLILSKVQHAMSLSLKVKIRTYRNAGKYVG